MRLAYTGRARKDLAEIWDWNEGRYGAGHAADYADFLVAAMESLESDPSRGRKVPGRPGLLRLTMRRGSRGHGHVAFYRVEEDEIRIVRVLHTARDWPSVLKDEQDGRRPGDPD